MFLDPDPITADGWDLLKAAGLTRLDFLVSFSSSEALGLLTVWQTKEANDAIQNALGVVYWRPPHLEKEG